MRKDGRVYVAGHRGLVGSAIVRALSSRGYSNLLLRTHAELDLTDQSAVADFFRNEAPDYVFLAAAKVGGILANSTYPADFIYRNLAIQSNVIHQAYLTGVAKLMFLGSSCIYPRDCPQPMQERHLLTGSLEPTNAAYAIAKIAGIKMCAAYNKQYGTRFVSVMPTNLYGPGDNYDLQGSHVIPALISKIHTAKTEGRDEAVIWGTGQPRREFLYSDDLADACVFLMENVAPEQIGEFVNIGVGEDISIGDLARLIASVVGFGGKLQFDTSKPDGTPRKLLDVTRLSEIGWRAKTGLAEGLAMAYADYLAHYAWVPQSRS